MRYFIEADNPDETFSIVERFDAPIEMESRLRACASLERETATPRRLGVWCGLTAALMATWTPRD